MAKIDTYQAHCPHCDHELNVPIGCSGLRAPCPKCEQKFEIPEPIEVMGKENFTVVCPQCDASLTMPHGSAGGTARCGACKHVFVIPEPEAVDEDMFSAWIEEGFEDELNERDDQAEQRLASEEQEIKARLAEERERQARNPGADDESIPIEELKTRRGKKSLADLKREREEAEMEVHPARRGPGLIKYTTPAPPPDFSGKSNAASDEGAAANEDAATEAGANPGAGDAEANQAVAEQGAAAQSATEQDNAGPSTDGKSASAMASVLPPTTVPRAAHREDLSNARPQGDYPAEVNPSSPRPYLQVIRCDLDGVELAFDPKWLAHEGFRLSAPVCCFFTGGLQRGRLIMRPMLFEGHADGRDISSTAEAYERPLLPEQPVDEALAHAGNIKFLDAPFESYMPYFVDQEEKRRFLRAFVVKRDDGGETCHVVMTHADVALQWVRNVNGVSGDEYRMLAHDIHAVETDAIPEVTRDRLDAWAPLQPMERIRLYLRDADLLSREDGLAGVVVTDRRMIFRRRRAAAEIALSEPAAVTGTRDGEHIHLTVDTEHDRYKACKLWAEEWPQLKALLEQAPRLNVFER